MSTNRLFSARHLRTAAVAFAVAGVAAATLVSSIGATADPGTPTTTDDKGVAASPSSERHGSYIRVPSPTVTVVAGGFASAEAACPSPQLVLGGGESNNSSGFVVLTDSFPLDNSRWKVYVKNNATVSQTFLAYAVCGYAL
jgi:hypothetical protein